MVLLFFSNGLWQQDKWWDENVTVAAVGASLIVCPVNIPMCDGNIKLNYVVIWTKPYKYPVFDPFVPVSGSYSCLWKAFPSGIALSCMSQVWPEPSRNNPTTTILTTTTTITLNPPFDLLVCSMLVNYVPHGEVWFYIVTYRQILQIAFRLARSLNPLPTPQIPSIRCW